MPLIIICGTPVSGKTYRAKELENFFTTEHGKCVEIISEDEAIKKLGYEKNTTYLDSQKEKRVRGYLKSEVIRLIGTDNVIILDGSNYIKGYRYELYCASKASKSTQCTIYTIRNHDEAWEANLQRKNIETDTKTPMQDRDSSTEPYTEDVFNALTRLRFEEPNSNNRWDSPIFTVQPNDPLDLEAVYKVLFEKKPPPPNMSTQNMKARALGKEEVLFLLDLISKKKIITTKSTNATNNKLKEDAWHAIAQEFCDMAGESRRPEQLRLKWENLKKTARKRNANIRRNNLKTGGGKMYIAPDEVLNRVTSMLNASCSSFSDKSDGDGTLTPPVTTTPIVEVYYVESEPLPELTPQEIMCQPQEEELKPQESEGPRNECNVAQKKCRFNRSINSLIKRRKLENDLKAAQKEKELAMAAYFRAKTKKVECEYLKLQLDIEKLQRENTKLKLEILKQQFTL